MAGHVYNAFGSVPPTVAPSTPVRYWHEGFLAGAVTFALTYPALVFATYQIPGLDGRVWNADLFDGLTTTAHYLTAGMTCASQNRDFLDGLQQPFNVAWRLGLSMVTSLSATAFVMLHALTPRKNVHHVTGAMLLEGKAALREVKRRTLTPQQLIDDPLYLPLTDTLYISKKQASQHIMFSGGVGAGKSVMIKRLLKSVIDRNLKAIILDPKGDMTSIFDKPIIVSPYDRRSYRWDLANDCRTPSEAAVFAAALAPMSAGGSEGANKFFVEAAQMVIKGCLMCLQNTKPLLWNLTDLVTLLNQADDKMKAMLGVHYPDALKLLGSEGGTQASGIQGSVTTATRLISDLAKAWPRVGRRKFSVREWLKEDYSGRSQIILQGGIDPKLTSTYVAAIINMASIHIINPQMTENEEGRFLGFFLDELPSIGRLNIDSLFALGRSKGVVMCCGYQDKAQLDLVYGEKEVATLMSQTSTKIYGRINPGETRDKLCQTAGKNKVASVNHSDKAQLHEDSKNVLNPSDLTDNLGFKKGKEMGPEGWGVSAIVDMGGDLMKLNFSGRTYPIVRAPQEPAMWTQITGAELQEYRAKQNAEAMAINNDSALVNAEEPATRQLGLSGGALEALLDM